MHDAELLAYLIEPREHFSRVRDLVSNFLRKFAGADKSDLWSSLPERDEGSGLLYTGVGFYSRGARYAPPYSRVATEAQLLIEYEGQQCLRLAPDLPRLDDNAEAVVFLAFFDAPETSTESVSILESVLCRAIRDHFDAQNAEVLQAAIRLSVPSKDVTSFFYRCIQDILIPRFRFQAASLFYFDEKTGALILGATTGIPRMERHGIKRADIKYFRDAKSYTARAFEGNITLHENVYRQGQLPNNRAGEDAGIVYSRINMPIRTRKKSGNLDAIVDPVGVVRAINANSDNNFHPLTAYQMATLEHFGEIIGAFARRYVKAMSVLHDQERATHGYFTDLLTMKFAASTIQTCASRLMGDTVGVMSPTSLVREIEHRCSDLLAVQDNMSHQILTVTRHVSNARLQATRQETDLCSQPYKEVFLRIIAAKKGMSHCYDRRELVLQSSGVTNLDEKFRDIPPLNITVGALYLVIRNIIENTIKYTAKHEVPRLDVTWRRVRNFVTFRFRDYGIGIAERERPFLFREGFRGYDAQSFQLRGNGLGLAVSKALIEEAAGKLEYEPVDGGEGSVFIVTVPIS